MRLPFTNAHAHVFNSDCAPDRFLMILPVPIVRRASKPIKGILDSRFGRATIHGLFKIFSSKDSNKRKAFDKYVAFLDAGTSATQLEIFQTTLDTGRAFDPAVRIVGLTMNMDYMDSEPSRRQLSFETQLEEIKKIKRYYPVNFFPFLGIDPRHKAGIELVTWAKPYFESGVVTPESKVYPYFCGLKLYPALGYFPFDTRLEDMYRYAEQFHLPVMTHCTRVGSQYIGALIETLIPDEPPMLMVPNNQNSIAAKTNILKRIKAYKAKGWIKNSKRGDNDFACDLFGHPENYIPILEMFPNLKLCLAHMGGSNEVTKSDSGDLKEIRALDPISWFEHIEAMMKKYLNLYTDVSYTLSDFNSADNPVLQKVLVFLNTPDDAGNPLGRRVLFGTDFFMTEQEKRERELYDCAKKNLGDWWDIIGRENTQKFLMQPL